MSKGKTRIVLISVSHLNFETCGLYYKSFTIVIYNHKYANFRVIWVKVVAPEKLLNVNMFPKINPDANFTIYVASKYLCVDMASCDIQKYFMLI